MKVLSFIYHWQPVYANVQASLAQEGGQFCSCRHTAGPAGRSAGTRRAQWKTLMQLMGHISNVCCIAKLHCIRIFTDAGAECIVADAAYHLIFLFYFYCPFFLPIPPLFAHSGPEGGDGTKSAKLRNDSVEFLTSRSAIDQLSAGAETAQPNFEVLKVLFTKNTFYPQNRL